MKLAIICHDPMVLESLHLSLHFVLAQKVLDDDKLMQWYASRSVYGDFTILDNGAAEGELVPWNKLLQVANNLRADEVVLPDVLRDGEETLKLSTRSYVLNTIPEPKRMIVPQGRNWEEWNYCLRELLQRCQPATIGIPKWQQELPGGRLNALFQISQYEEARRCNIHMLGMALAPREEFREINVHSVRSLDTALPIALAQQQMIVGDGTQRASYAYGEPFAKLLAVQNITALLKMSREVFRCTFP